MKSVGLFSDGNEFGYIQNRSPSVLRTGGSLRVSGINYGLSEAQQQNRKDGITCDANSDQDAALGFGQMQLLGAAVGRDPAVHISIAKRIPAAEHKAVEDVWDATSKFLARFAE